MARARRTRFVRPSPRTKMWIGAGVGPVTITGSALSIVSSLSAGALLLLPFTVLRTRMILQFESDQATTNERPQGDFGRIVVSQAAAAAGAASVPDPSSTDGDPEADWFVHQPVFNSFQIVGTAGASAVAASWSSGRQYVIDSKAMRKVGFDDNIVSMFSETSGLGAQLNTRGRMLIQLH